MEALRTLLPLMVQLSLAALVFAIGLDARLSDLTFLWRRPKLLLRAVLAISVVVPIAAIVVLGLLPIHPVARAGIALMALAPLPPLAPGKQLKLGGDRAYVYGLYVAYAALTVLIVPLTVAILDRAYGAEVPASPAAIARMMLISVAAPLVAGMAIRALAANLATKAAIVVRKLAMLLVLVVFVPLLVKAWPAISSLVGDGTILAISLVSVAAILGGHLLGGPERGRRGALAAAAATRHPGIAIMLATSSFHDQRVVAAIILFMIVSLVLVTLYQLWLKRTAPDVATGDVGSVAS